VNAEIEECKRAIETKAKGHEDACESAVYGQ